MGLYELIQIYSCMTSFSNAVCKHLSLRDTCRIRRGDVYACYMVDCGTGQFLTEYGSIS